MVSLFGGSVCVLAEAGRGCAEESPGAGVNMRRCGLAKDFVIGQLTKDFAFSLGIGPGWL